MGRVKYSVCERTSTSVRHKGRLNYPPYVLQNRHYKKEANLFLIYPFCTTRYEAGRSVAKPRYEAGRSAAGGRLSRVGGKRGGILR